MGHSKTRTNLAHKLKSKRSARIGVLILIGGMLALITEAQFEPRTVKVTRVIDGDTIQVFERWKTVHRALDRSRHARDEAPDRGGATLRPGGQRLYHSGARRPHSAARDRPHRRHRGPLMGACFATSTWTARTSTPGSSVRDTLTPSGAFDTRSGPRSYGSKKQRSGWERAYGPRLESNRPGLAPDRCPGVPSRGDPNATSG